MFQTEEKLAVIDFGGQYTHLIARRVRELGVYSEIYQPHEVTSLNCKQMKALILSGGPNTVLEKKELSLESFLKNFEKPILGICFGHQLLADLWGGEVKQEEQREYGLSLAQLNNNALLFNGINQQQKVWMSHGDYVARLPSGFKGIASTDNIDIAAYENNKLKIFGLQFHPEVTHTENGKEILKNFLVISGFKRNWQVGNMKNKLIEEIREKTGKRDLFLLLSGGVDSLVALALCLEAVKPEKIHPLHIDTGFMRKNESEEIISYLNKIGFKNLKLLRKEGLFLQNLAGVTDPEKKREIIGKLFVEVLNQEVQEMDSQKWLLVQGTIYPDTIESGGSEKAAKIKTHHNRVKEIEQLRQQNKVIEPLKEFYKDEVRELGKELGLPVRLLQRQPFPGPGLAIRVICSKGESKNNFKQEENDLRDLLLQKEFSGTILPIQSVGIQGDSRTYHHPALLWNKKGNEPNWNKLRSLSNTIINKLQIVNRVIFSFYPLKHKLLYQELYLEKENLNILREVDYIVRKNIEDIDEIWQAPVILLPLFLKNGRKNFVLRPVCSRDAMTADFYEMSAFLLKQIIRQVHEKLPKMGYIFYDITTKPPGTIEWE